MTIPPPNRMPCSRLGPRSPASFDAAASSDIEFRRRLAMLLNSTIYNFRPRARGKVQLPFMLQHPSWADTLSTCSHRRGSGHRGLDAFALSSFCRSTTGELSRRGACGKQSVRNSLSFAGYTAQFKKRAIATRVTTLACWLCVLTGPEEVLADEWKPEEDHVLPLAVLKILHFKARG